MISYSSGKIGYIQLLNTKFEDMIYYIAFIAYSYSCVFGFTTAESLVGLPISALIMSLQLFALCCLVFKILFQKMNGFSWLSFFLIVAIGFISWRCSGENYFLWLALFVLCGIGVDIEALARISLFVSVSAIIFVCALLNVGLVRDVLIYGTNGVRHSLGFVHPNTLARYLVVASISYLVSHYNGSIFANLAMALSCAFIAQMVTGSRTAVLLLVFQAILLVFFSRVHNFELKLTVLKVLFVGAFVLIIASFYFMFCYNIQVPLHNRLNFLLSDRLALAKLYAEVAPFAFFGRDFSSLGFYGLPSNFTVDNAWCHLFLREGIIPTVLLLAGVFVLIIHAILSNHIDGICLGLLLMVVYSCSETVGIMVDSNYFLIAMAPIVLGNHLTIGDSLFYPRGKCIGE